MKTYLTFLIPLLITNLFSATITVSGRVMDENNDSIQNVNVYTDTKGITTDENGYFDFGFPEGTHEFIINMEHLYYCDIHYRNRVTVKLAV